MGSVIQHLAELKVVEGAVLYFVFDVMVLAGRDLMREPLEMCRDLLEKKPCHQAF
jgi:ATP-dependent DNA ligase